MIPLFRAIGEERQLDWSVSEGWELFCEFQAKELLDCPVPYADGGPTWWRIRGEGEDDGEGVSDWRGTLTNLI